MQTVRVDFDVASGQNAQRNVDWQRTATFTNPGGSPYDLTGMSMVMTIRPFAGGTPVATIRSSDSGWQGIKVPTPTNGQVTFQISEASIASCPDLPDAFDTYSCIYDFIVTDDSGHSFCWFYGAFDIAYGVGDPIASPVGPSIAILEAIGVI